MRFGYSLREKDGMIAGIIDLDSPTELKMTKVSITRRGAEWLATVGEKQNQGIPELICLSGYTDGTVVYDITLPAPPKGVLSDEIAG